MRLPIWYALHEPERPAADFGRLDLAAIGALHFERLDPEQFPCVDLAVQAGKRGGLMPGVLNAANEVAVAAFLEERLPFIEIPSLLASVLEQAERAPEARASLGLQTLHEADAWARRAAAHYVQQTCSTGERSC